MGEMEFKGHLHLWLQVPFNWISPAMNTWNTVAPSLWKPLQTEKTGEQEQAHQHRDVEKKAGFAMLLRGLGRQTGQMSCCPFSLPVCPQLWWLASTYQTVAEHRLSVMLFREMREGPKGGCFLEEETMSGQIWALSLSSCERRGLFFISRHQFPQLKQGNVQVYLRIMVRSQYTLNRR